jgi:hypothetical protein
MDRFNCYYDFTPIPSEPISKQCGFCYYCRDFTCPHHNILFETKTNNNDNIFHINSDIGCLARPTNFIEAPKGIVRVRDLADKGEQAILLVK